MRCPRLSICALRIPFVVATAMAVVLGTSPAWALTAEQEAKLLAADGAADDWFGRSVAFDGDTAVIGAFKDDDNGEESGSAYVFTRTMGVWTEQAKLLPSDGEHGDRFGRSVALNGDTAVIGASADDGNGYDSGSAYVFTRTAGVWTEQAKLLPSDGAAYAYFGRSVALNGDTALIGAEDDYNNGSYSGSAYVFTRTAGVWTEQAKLLASDGLTHQRFGSSVVIHADTAVIGAWGDDDNGSSSGSAYVFTRTAGVWTEQAKLLASDGAADDWFGYAVALDGDSALVGATRDDDNDSRSGSAYVFTRTADVWTEQAKLLASDGAAYDHFGYAVAFDGDTAVIGAVGDDDNGFESGSAYVFTRTEDTWSEQVKLLPSDGEHGDRFGISVALNGDTAVIGAYTDDDNGHWSGSAYVFRLYDDDVPAISALGLVLLCLAMLGSGAYFMRRRRSSPTRHHSL